MNIDITSPAPPAPLRAAPPRLPQRTMLALALITLAAFVLRLSQLNQGLLGDEVWTYQDVVGRSLGGMLRILHTGAENSPPLFFVLAWAAAKLGNPSIWIRVPTLLLGTATLPVIFLIGRETVGERAGVLAAAIVAASPFSTYYGVEARAYGTMAFFIAVSTFAVLRATRTRSRRWWALYALAATGAAYSHYTAVFILGAQGLWSMWICRDRIRQPLIASCVPVLLYLPWVSHVRGKALTIIGMLEPLTARNVSIDAGRLLFGYPYAPLSAIPTVAGLIAVAVCALAGAVALIGRMRAMPASRFDRRSGVILIAMLAVATPLGLLLYSLGIADIWDSRGQYASVPATALALAGLVIALPHWPRIAAITVVTGVLIFGTIRAISPRWNRGPSRAVSAYIDRTARPSDPVAVVESVQSQAIIAQLQHPHRMTSFTGAWRLARPGGAVYLIWEDAFSLFKIGIPDPTGFRLVRRVRYGDVLPTEILTYIRR